METLYDVIETYADDPESNQSGTMSGAEIVERYPYLAGVMVRQPDSVTILLNLFLLEIKRL